MKRNFNRKPLYAGIAAAGLALACTHTIAAESDEVLEEVIVTGSFAGSLAKALETKRNAAGLVDSILAEDIADFPDQNLAESLQRIPGVTITREGGEGRNITVRGLNARFTRVQVNGIQSQSLAAGGSSGVQTRRSFDFNVFASELFNRLDVYKTTSAELEEGSLGATVSLRTGRPFDYDPNTLVVNYQQGYNEQSSESDPRGSALFSTMNEEGTLGALVSVAYTERSSSLKGAETGRWSNGGNFLSCSGCTAGEDDTVINAWHPRFPRYADKTTNQERLGITASFQWRPSDSTLLSFDVLHAEIDAERSEPYMEAISLARNSGVNGVANTDIASYTLDGNNSLIAAEMDGVDVRAENFARQWDSEYNQYTLDLEHDFSDRLHLKVLLGTSESELNNRDTTLIYEHFSENDTRRTLDYAEANDTVTYDYSNQLSPSIAYGFDTANPANWELSEFRDRVYVGEATSNTFRADIAYDLNDTLILKAGVTQKNYNYELAGVRADRSFSSADALDGTVDGVACGISNVVTSDQGSATTAGGQTFFLPDLGRVGDFVNSGCWVPAVRAGDTREVEEDSLGFFGQVDFDTEILGNRFRGNVGVRTVETELASTGLTAVGPDLVQVTVENEYTDTLPAMNLVYELSDELILRGSWAEVMSRPGLSDLNPGGSVSIFGERRISYGNPLLDPFRAEAMDVSIEWYFTDDAVISLAYFQKDIESFTTSSTDTIAWSATGLPDSLLGAQVDELRNADFEVRRRINGKGGDLDGFELQYQQPLTFLPGPDWVKKFGVIANYSKISSEVTRGDIKGPLEGQSDKAYNATLYWENETFSARISLANTGEYFSNLSSSNSANWRIIEETNFVDISASYNLTENLKVSLEALNITDESRVEVMDESARRLISEETTGPQYFVGVSYRL